MAGGSFAQKFVFLIAIALLQIFALGQCQTVSSENFQEPIKNISAVDAIKLQTMEKDVANLGEELEALKAEFSGIKDMLLNLSVAIWRVNSVVLETKRARDADIARFRQRGFNYSDVTRCSYKAVLRRGYFRSARDACHALSSEVASIHSRVEQDFIKKLVGGKRKRYWIGAKDNRREGYWRWVDATPFDFEYWQVYEPSSSGSHEDCTEVNFVRNRPLGGWNDLPCRYTLDGYICKKCFN